MDESLLKKIVTGIAFSLYLALFFYIFLQLILVLIYDYKRWCYRTAVLFVCTIWAGLRATLFSYYWYAQFGHLHENFPELSRNIGTKSYFILFSLPLYLQFSVLCLLVAYFFKVLAISDDYYNPSHICTAKRIKYIILTANFIVLIVNVICSILIKEKTEDLSRAFQDSLRNISEFPETVVFLICVRVIVNGCMFILLSSLLGIVVVWVSKTQEARLLLETENITQRGAISMGIFLVSLYVMRTAANVLALIPSVPWIYDTDQIDLLSDSSHGYYTFLCVLFFWEYLPTFASVYFFRVKKPRQSPPTILFQPAPEEDEEQLFSDDLDSCSLTFQDVTDTMPPWYTSYLGGDNRLPSSDESSPGFRSFTRAMSSSDRVYS